MDGEGGKLLPGAKKVQFSNVFKRAWLIGLAVILGFFNQATGWGFQAVAEDRVAIEHVTVIDVESGEALPDQTILIKAGKIVEISASNESKIEDGIERIDGTGKFVIPGLWDMHIHWFAQNSMDLFPINGVTGVRVMWGNAGHHQWRKDFESEKKFGPRMVIASMLVDGPQPFWPGSRIAKNAKDGADAVDEAVEAGADFVKVYTLLPREAYFAIVEACKKQGMVFAGHVPRMVSAWEASRAGQKSMEHLYEIRLSSSSEEEALRKMIAERVAKGDGVVRSALRDSEFNLEINKRTLQTFDEAKAKKLFAEFKKNETWQCPTLTVLRNLAYLEEPVVQDNPNLKYLPKGMRSFIAPSKDPRKRTAEKFKQSQQQFRGSLKLVKMMDDAGVPLIAGTDVLNPFCLPGFSLHDELKLMVEAGLSPAAALRTATINPARFFGKEAEFGTVATGKRADLVILNSSPLLDIGHTTAIDMVILRGKVFSRERLDEMLKTYEN